MSLVSEALKKAEREAAAREARERGLPQPLATPPQPYRARRGQRPGRGRAVLWLVVGGVAAAIVIAVFFSGPGPEEGAPDEESTPTASATRTPASESPTSTASVVERSTAVPEAPLHDPEPATPVPSASAPKAPQPPPPSPETTPIERTVPASASEPAKSNDEPRPAAAPPAPRTGNEYLRRVDLPDGTRLELGGIAYSESAPFAYLNGKLLKVGEATGGYTLVAIERDRVRVRGAAGEITLRLKP